jgi:replicative DNA helicase
MSQSARTAERLLPQNIEAECGVLGSIIIDPEALVLVADFLRAEDFYRDAHRSIYEVMLHLYNQQRAADFITICDVLESQSKLEEVGGASYITSLINQVPTSGNALYYGRIVERTATLRRLIGAAARIAAAAYEAEDDASSVCEQAEQLIFEVTQRALSLGTDASLAELLSSYMGRLDQLSQRRASIVGVPTGFADLDRLTGGLRRSDLIILAARPSLGKTGLALSLAHNAALQYGQRIGIFSLEMSQEQLTERLLAMETGINLQRLSTGNIEDHEWERIVVALGRLSEVQIRIDGTSVLSPIQMRSRARRWVVEHGLDLIIVDYLQLMQPSDTSSKRKMENRVQVIDEISRNLKLLARELNIPILALAQLSRAVETRVSKVPQLSDLRESGCLPGDTPIYLPDEGVYSPLQDLVGRSGFRVLSLNQETWKLEPHVVTHAFATGRKLAYKMTTHTGRTIRATGNHQFLTLEGWKRLDMLLPGMHMAVPRTLAGPVCCSMTDSELALLGHLIGDGCTLQRLAIQYISGDLGLAETVAHLASLVFGDAVRPHIEQVRRETDRHTRYYVYLTASRPLTHGKRNPVAVWLEKLGVFNLRSYEKVVPQEVFRQSAEGIACFLRHLWATDGSIHLDHGKRRSVGIYYASSSRKLACQVQSLLLRLGINALLSCQPQGGKGRDQYHVTVSGRAEIATFFALIGGLGEKKTLHQTAIVNYMEHRIANTNRDVIPRQAWRKMVVPAMQVAGLSQRAMQAALGGSYCGTALFKRNLGRERALRVATVVQSEELARLAQSDVYWDSIVTIEPDGETDVYDLTVEGLHNFVAGDIVVHNSIEMNADIVMFIYRDEVYTPDSQRRGIADIIVAKHRNGPTGTFCLRFEPQTTRFRDVADEIVSPLSPPPEEELEMDEGEEN